MATETAYERLLYDVCVRLGFCGSVVNGHLMRADALMPKSGQMSADQFATAVFTAEGMEPNSQEFRAALAAAFRMHMGGDTAEAHVLQRAQADK